MRIVVSNQCSLKLALAYFFTTCLFTFKWAVGSWPEPTFHPHASEPRKRLIRADLRDD